MSEVEQIDNVMTLEDLFLSAEFGKTVVEDSTPVIDPLFWETSPGAPLLPLAAFPSTTGAHGTTTHMRRNRAFATASGAAAVLLIAVGLISSTGKPAKGPVDAKGGKHPTTRTTVPGSHTPAPSHINSGGPGSIGSGSGSTGFALGGSSSGPRISTAADVVAGPGASVTPTPGATPTPVKTPSPTPSATAPSGTILSPVISLLGHVVVPVGNTVTGLGGTLTTALPPLTPVTNIVSGLGTTLSDLGNNLIVSAA